jgi:hypothetical protein
MERAGDTAAVWALSVNRPVLKRMMRGEAMALMESDQRLLAAWGAKTAYMAWGRTQKDRGVPGLSCATGSLDRESHTSSPTTS